MNLSHILFTTNPSLTDLNKVFFLNRETESHADKSSLIQTIRIPPNRRPQRTLKLQPPPLNPRAISHKLPEPINLSVVAPEDLPPRQRIEMRKHGIADLRQSRLPLIAEDPRFEQLG